jgi:hypothetical protein
MMNIAIEKIQESLNTGIKNSDPMNTNPASLPMPSGSVVPKLSNFLFFKNNRAQAFAR